jgi:hypothetical protein
LHRDGLLNIGFADLFVVAQCVFWATSAWKGRVAMTYRENARRAICGMGTLPLTHTRTHTHTRARMRSQMHTHMHTNKHEHTCTNKPPKTRANTHTSTHTSSNTHARVLWHALSCLRVWFQLPMFWHTLVTFLPILQASTLAGAMMVVDHKVCGDNQLGGSRKLATGSALPAASQYASRLQIKASKTSGRGKGTVRPANSPCLSRLQQPGPGHLTTLPFIKPRSSAAPGPLS